MAMHQLTLALYQPDIPQNAGTMLRACACLGFQAAIIGPTGFPAADRNFRRAGMDYLDQLTISRHISFESFQHWRKSTQQGSQARRLILLSTKAEGSYLDLAYQPDDILMVGRESAGVPEEVAAARDAYYAKRTKDREDAINNDLYKDQHPSMPINSDRQTRVTFGGNNKK